MSDRNERIQIMEDTKKIFKDGEYYGIKIPQNIIQYPVDSTIRYGGLKIKSDFENVKSGSYKPEIYLVAGDCLDVGLLLNDYGYNSVVLNMASAYNPGGGYLTGASAQEEQLFRRSNLHMCLHEQENKLYPIPKYGVLYTQNVVIIKDKNYQLLNSYRLMSFISAAAHRCRNSDFDRSGYKRLKNSVEADTIKKIDAIFMAAILKGHTSIVLSAFGCGAYNNPPYHIAELFKASIAKFGQHFKYIIFAIIDDSNAMRNTKVGNIHTFSNVLNLKPISTEEFNEIL